jgi:hypothetical protein
LTVTGTSGINAGANSITLNTSGNDFGGAVTVDNTGANNVALNNGNHALTVGTGTGLVGGNLGTTTTGTGTTIFGTTSAGSLTVSSGGAVSQTGGVTVTGTSGINAGANAINLSTSANDFGGAVTLTTTGTANNAALNNGANALSFAANVSGDLTIKSGNTTATGALVSGGTMTLTTATLGLGQNVSAATVKVVNSGALTGSGLVTAGTLNLDGSASVGSSGAGEALNTKVGSISLGETAPGNKKPAANNWINQSIGTAVDIGGATDGGSVTLTAGATTVGKAILNAGAGNVTLNTTTFGLGQNVDGATVTFNNSGTLTLQAAVISPGKSPGSTIVTLKGTSGVNFDGSGNVVFNSPVYFAGSGGSYNETTTVSASVQNPVLEFAAIGYSVGDVYLDGENPVISTPGAIVIGGKFYIDGVPGVPVFENFIAPAAPTFSAANTSQDANDVFGALQQKEKMPKVEGAEMTPEPAVILPALVIPVSSYPTMQ